LQPIYAELLRLGKSLGGDVKACPCKTIVPLYREHVFAQIKPTTNSRIDLGLALTLYKGKLPKRIIDTGGLAKKDRITHRIPLGSVDEIADEVEKWLKTAYELDS
jgi:dUTPase